MRYQINKYVENFNKLDMKLKTVILIAVIVFVWMLSGVLKSKQDILTTVVSTSTFTPKTLLSVATVKTKYMTFPATGLANNSALLFPQVSGRVIKKFVTSGTKLKGGDKILQIENATLKERVEQMRDALQTAQTKYQAVSRLYKNGLSSKLDFGNAKTSLNQAEADLMAAVTGFNDSFVVAPFNGYIDDIQLHEGDVINVMNSVPVGKFINLEEVSVKAFISQKDRSHIKNSNEALIINSANKQMPAKINFISDSSDPITGTFAIEALSKNTLHIADGETVNLMIKVGDFESHKIPISTLIIDKDGDLAVKVIDSTQNRTYKIDIIDEDEKDIWIAGLPNKCEIILAGQSYTN
jgi:multidrug efflux system membrane fusion protein